MRLGWDTYTCKSCGHFEQNPDLRLPSDQDDPTTLKFCNCQWCLNQRGGERL